MRKSPFEKAVAQAEKAAGLFTQARNDLQESTAILNDEADMFLAASQAALAERDECLAEVERNEVLLSKLEDFVR